MIYNSKSEGNSVFHIRTDPKSGKQDIAVLPFLWSEKQLLYRLMESENIQILTVTAPDESNYLFILDQNHARPYPSVMILKAVYENADIKIIDVEENDLQAAHYAIENYLN